MKRSEMIWDLATELILFDTGINYDKAKEIAEHLLNKAENSGMKPPVEIELHDQLRDGNWYPYIGHIWELEDE